MKSSLHSTLISVGNRKFQRSPPERGSIPVGHEHRSLRPCVVDTIAKPSIQDGRLVLRTAKTGVPVRVLLPKLRLDAREGIGSGEFYFWSGKGTKKSISVITCRLLTSFTTLQRFKAVTHIAGGIPSRLNAYSHEPRLRMSQLSEGIAPLG